MWFTREQFEVCNELRVWGLTPRFEPGDVVARGFADLGFEEFQVLPGRKLLSLTAGSVTPLPDDHAGHLFWIPSIDESVALLEKLGTPCIRCERQDGREWRLEFQCSEELCVQRGSTLHDAVLRALLASHKRSFSGKQP